MTIGEVGETIPFNPHLSVDLFYTWPPLREDEDVHVRVCPLETYT